MQTIQTIDLIAVDPDVRQGVPILAGTTVTVADVMMAKVYHHQEPDEIAEWYNLTLAQVHAALAFYYIHKEMMDQQIRDRIRRSESLKEQRIGSRHSLLS